MGHSTTLSGFKLSPRYYLLEVRYNEAIASSSDKQLSAIRIANRIRHYYNPHFHSYHTVRSSVISLRSSLYLRRATALIFMASKPPQAVAGDPACWVFFQWRCRCVGMAGNTASRLEGNLFILPANSQLRICMLIRWNYGRSKIDRNRMEEWRASAWRIHVHDHETLMQRISISIMSHFGTSASWPTAGSAALNVQFAINSLSWSKWPHARIYCARLLRELHRDAKGPLNCADVEERPQEEAQKKRHNDRTKSVPGAQDFAPSIHCLGNCTPPMAYWKSKNCPAVQTWLLKLSNPIPVTGWRTWLTRNSELDDMPADYIRGSRTNFDTEYKT